MYVATYLSVVFRNLQEFPLIFTTVRNHTLYCIHASYMSQLLVAGVREGFDLRLFRVKGGEGLQSLII